MEVMSRLVRGIGKCFIMAVGLALLFEAHLWAATVNVTVQTKDINTGLPVEIGTGFRWLLEEDQTYPNVPGAPSPYGPRDPNSLSYGFYKSYMPVAAKGEVPVGGGGTVSIPNVDPTKRYYLSVLPHRPAGSDCSTPGCYSMSGAQVVFPVGTDPVTGTTDVTVLVAPQPIKTAQISVFVFNDNNPINNAPDLPQEKGIGGFSVIIFDQGGQVLTDAFGNPLGTTYLPDGTVDLLGNGIITTMTQTEIDLGHNPYGLKVGEALIKNLAPGKYGVQVVPTEGAGWQQVTTIEGTKTIDAWVKANEPRYLVEFGPSFPHIFMGFVQPFNAIPAPGPGQGVGTITGQVVNGHLDRPPALGTSDGHPWPNCWIGLNATGLGGAQAGLYAAPCNADSTFSIPNVPPGTYELVLWDQFLDNIIGFRTAIVPPNGGTVDLGKVQVLAWFARQDHYVFLDSNQNGKRDPGEAGIPEQVVNLRFRDGTIYQSFPTDAEGYVPFDEIFPFFHWQVAEVDFARFKATGVTVYVDAGGPVDTTTTAAPGFGKLNPQIQPDSSPSRTDGPGTLLEAFQGFQGTTNVFEWGKAPYGFGENGGISGIVHYATTRAEDDPRYAVGDPWEPGIPRVQVNLYDRDPSAPGVIKDVNGVAGIQLADVDNYPFGWRTGGAMGPEDVKRNNIGGTAGLYDPASRFNAGDAVQIVTTDSWDDNPPTGCVNNPTDPFYGPPLPSDLCHDSLRNYNQVRPGVFDGGYAFTSKVTGGASSGGLVVEPLPPGYYIVEAVAPKGYEHQTEESKNVDFGDTFVVSPLALPPVCVNNDAPQHIVPAELTLFPGVAAPNAGNPTPLCDRKEIYLAGGANPGVNFFLYTEVPAAAHVIGQVTSDITNDPNPNSPSFGEKFGPAFIPISFRDWTGHEVARVYTNEYGKYNALVPSTYNINVPSPSGVGPNMLQVCLNHPGPIKDPNNPTQFIIDPYFNKQFNQLCLTFQFEPARTTILDTPVLPAAAFVGGGHWQLDCNCPDRSPRIQSVSATNSLGGGPYIEIGGSRQLSIVAVGTVQVRDPNGLNNGGNPLITRDYGFGTSPGSVTIGGVPLENVVWSNDVITGDVPATATTGQLVVTRADSGLSTVNSVTVHVGNGAYPVSAVTPGTTIQAAVDAAVPGQLVLVPPGTYWESIVITKPIQLQGWGAGSTVINALKVPTESIQSWHELVNRKVNCEAAIDLLPGQPNNQDSPLNLDPPFCGKALNTGLFGTEEGAAILVAPKQNAFSNAVPSRIDGFTVTGSSQGGGIIVSAYARFLEISNNLVTGNLGLAGGGIRLGHPSLLDPTDPTLYVSAQNTNVAIHHNHVSENASVGGVGVLAQATAVPGGGIAIYNGSDAYRLSDNFVCGNLSMSDGGGVAHYGKSPNGVIANNKIVFNEAFNGAPGQGGSGGGLLVAGLPQPAGATLPQTPGSGSVLIDANLIQGNSAGTGDGAGVLLRQINGQDVLISPTSNTSWYSVEMTNNIIVNNVAGQAGGGIALQDAAKVAIVNNTIAHNDSTATAGMAFVGAAANQTVPQPAGIVSNHHSAALLAALGANTTFPRFSDPLLVNDIILNNRSMYYNTGTLVFAGVNDLAVLPLGSICGTAFCTLNPQYSLLSTSSVGYAATNVLVDETVTPVFFNAYYNAPPDTPYLGSIMAGGVFLQPTITVVPKAAPAVDEGGNFIQTFYGPLSLVGNYHLLDTAPAANRGTDALLAAMPSLSKDYDGDMRPQGGVSDIGADETSLAGSQAPVFISTPITTATAGSFYFYIVEATDPDPGQSTTLTFSLLTAPPGMMILPAVPTATSSRALVFWISPTVGTHTVTIEVRDTTAAAATQSYQLVVGQPVQPPVAVNDLVKVNKSGTFVLPAPGVLANDQGTGLTAIQVSNVPQGTAVLASDGSVTYTPPAKFVGTQTFSYLASNGTIPSNTAIVSLYSELAVIESIFVDKVKPTEDQWKLKGMSARPGTILTITHDQSATIIGTVTVSATGDWTFSQKGPFAYTVNAGDTLTIRSNSPEGGELLQVPITKK